MTPQLKNAIADVEPPSKAERQLLQILIQSNANSKEKQDFSASTAQVWQGSSLEKILETQSPKTVHSLNELAADFWPEDESIEDFLTFLRQ